MSSSSIKASSILDAPAVALPSTVVSDTVDVLHPSAIEEATSTSMPDFSLGALRPYSMDNVLNREYLLTRLTWASSDAQGSVKACYLFPDALFGIPSLWAKLQAFDFMRADVVVRLRVSGSTSVTGSLMASTLPYYDPTANGTAMGNLYSQSVAPTTIIDAGCDCEYEFVVPYVAPTRALAITRYATGTGPTLNKGYIGAFMLRVLNPLATVGTSNPSVGVSVYARFENVHLGGQTHVVRSVYTPSGNVSGAVIANSTEQVVRSEGVVTSGLRSARRTAARLISTSDSIFSALTTLASSSGLDDPSSLVPVKRMIPSLSTDLPHGATLDNSVNLGTYPDSAVASDGVFPEDPTAFPYLSSRLCLISAGTFNSATPVDTLRHTYVGPHVVAMTSSAYRRTPASLITSYHQYWRGGMKYRFVFVTNKFTTCQLAIDWVPNATERSIVNPGGDTHRKIVDVCGTTVVDFEVPYSSIDLWKIGGRHFSAGNAETFAGGLNSYFNGNLVLSLLVPIRTNGDPTATPGIVYWNLFSAPGEDFQVACYLDRGAIPLAQSREDATIRNYDVGPFSPLFPGSRVYDTGVNMGERITNFKTLSHVYTNPVLNQTASSSGFVITEFPTVQAMDLLSCFLFYRGSLRMRVYLSGENLYSLTAGAVNESGVVTTSNNGGNYFVVDPHLCKEVAIQLPYSTPHLCSTMPAHSPGSGSYTTNRGIMCNSFLGSSTTPITYSYLTAFGDDASFGVLVAPPSIPFVGNVLSCWSGVYPA